MARTITCDTPGCTELGAFLLSILDDGTSKAFCVLHYGVHCAMFVQALAGDEPDVELAAASVNADLLQAGIDLGPNGVEVFTCSGCGAEFASIETIEQHVSDVHTAPVPAELVS